MESELVGYFIGWGVYERNVHAATLAERGAAQRLTTINYAFAGIDEELRCTLLDPYADYQRIYSADESVDGAADDPGQPLKGNFNQFAKLKAAHPQLKLVIAVGGWGDSARFSDAALPENRTAFVASCIDLFIRGQIDPARGIAMPGLFDGIDIDWEYPGACGASCDYRPEDTQNFTALLQEFRRQLDEIDPRLLLTVAAPAPARLSSLWELDQVAEQVDWINIMGYDYHGSWLPNGPTNHHANLFTDPSDPSESPLSSNEAVQRYLAGGVPAEKLVLGVPFYGKGWRGVADANYGLFQPAQGLAPGAFEAGGESYARLTQRELPAFFDEATGASWLYDGDEFWSYDDVTSLARKAQYVREQNLRGIMFWELSGDDDDGTLVRTLDEALTEQLEEE